MIPVILMILATAASVIFLAESGKAGRMAAAEIVLSKAWSYRFERQRLTETMEEFLAKNEKYHTVSDKKAEKKRKEWEKQIDGHEKQEEKYMSGKKFTIMDLMDLFGYQLLTDIRLDGDNDLLRKLTSDCEHSGYVELERDQETGGKKNSAIYAYYLLASLISSMYMGVILGCVAGVVMMAAGKTGGTVLVPMAVCFGLVALYGYLPYDNLRTRAKKRQEELGQSFPNVISEITLLVMAGMNIVKAMEEAAENSDTLMGRELRLAMKEMGQASTLQAALTRLQCRCDNKYLDKMVTIIAKSYVAGNVNLADDLRAVNEECWLDRKHNARRMGEAVQNRLFIPTMLMFIGILVVIVVPAMSGFSL